MEREEGEDEDLWTEVALDDSSTEASDNSPIADSAAPVSNKNAQPRSLASPESIGHHGTNSTIEMPHRLDVDPDDSPAESSHDDKTEDYPALLSNHNSETSLGTPLVSQEPIAEGNRSQTSPLTNSHPATHPAWLPLHQLAMYFPYPYYPYPPQPPGQLPSYSTLRTRKGGKSPQDLPRQHASAQVQTAQHHQPPRPPSTEQRAYKYFSTTKTNPTSIQACGRKAKVSNKKIRPGSETARNRRRHSLSAYENKTIPSSTRPKSARIRKAAATARQLRPPSGLHHFLGTGTSAFELSQSDIKDLLDPTIEGKSLLDGCYHC